MEFTERDLIIPALIVINKNPGCDTSALIEQLISMMEPTGHNGEIISGRQDTYFSQKVRNLKSHNTLEKYGFARYTGGKWYISKRGIEYLDEEPKIIDSLKNQGIKISDIDEEIQDFSEIIIEEGAIDWRTVTQKKRSDKLRTHAIDFFKKKNNGEISCLACGFNFEKTYGEHGQGFIEIHHIRPVSIMDLKGEKQTLEDALKKLAPLCPNCHRMIHRKKNNMLPINELKKLLKDKRRNQK